MKFADLPLEALFRSNYWGVAERVAREGDGALFCKVSAEHAIAVDDRRYARVFFPAEANVVRVSDHDFVREGYEAGIRRRMGG